MRPKLSPPLARMGDDSWTSRKIQRLKHIYGEQHSKQLGYWPRSVMPHGQKQFHGCEHFIPWYDVQMIPFLIPRGLASRRRFTGIDWTTNSVGSCRLADCLRSFEKSSLTQRDSTRIPILLR